MNTDKKDNQQPMGLSNSFESSGIAGQSYRTLSQQLKLLKPKLDVNQRPNQENSPQLSRFKKLLVNTVRMMTRSSYPIEP